MRLSTGNILYKYEGAWTQINDIRSGDISITTGPNRSQWDRLGAYTNETFNGVEVTYLRGSNEYLDDLGLYSDLELQITDGAIIYEGHFIVDTKINVKTEEGTTTILSLIPNNEYEFVKKVKAGAISGVQDVEIGGISIVDPDTGIANITTLADKQMVTENIERIDGNISELNNSKAEKSEVERLENDKQNKLTIGNDLEMVDDVISVKGSTIKVDEEGIYIEVGE